MKKLSFSLTALLLSITLWGCKDDTVGPEINQSDISLVAVYSTYASVNGLFIRPVNFRDYAFLADGSNGMQIVDVTQVNLPDSVSSFDTDGIANDVTLAVINGKLYAFISDYGIGCVIVDVSDPLNPQFTASLTNSTQHVITSCVDANNRILYLGSDEGWINVVDISPLPSPPIQRLFFGTTNERINGLYPSDSSLYCAYGNTGLVIFDLKNPFDPMIHSVTNTSGAASDVVVNTGYAYVADSFNGLLIFDVSNPVSPSLLSRYPPAREVLGIAVNNNSAYTADNGFGIESLNISSPSNPTQTGYIRTYSSALNIFYFGGYLYLAAAEGGMAIFQPVN